VGVKESEVCEFNILMFGTAGASKSSFVNTVLTMLQDPDATKISRVAEMGGTAGHATRKLHCFQVSNTIPDVKFNLWDTWGVDRKAYTKDIVDNLVDGKLPKDWSMTHSFEKYKERFDAMGEKVQTQMHAIVFFVPQAMLTDLDDEETARIQDMFRSLIAKLYNPLVILSKVDEVCPAIRDDPLATVKEVEDLRKQCATVFKIGLNSVRYTVNYTDEEKRTFGIEALAYENIESALQHCESFVQSRIMRYGSVKASDVVDKDGLIWPEDSDED
jgi:predicted GTPase